MNISNKRVNRMEGNQNSKRVKKECSYGEACYRLNPAHFREYSHPHLEAILDTYSGSGQYDIPDKYNLQKSMILDQLNIIMEKKLYDAGRLIASSLQLPQAASGERSDQGPAGARHSPQPSAGAPEKVHKTVNDLQKSETVKSVERSDRTRAGSSRQEGGEAPPAAVGRSVPDSEYRPVVPPTRRAEDYLKLVRPRGAARAKLAAAAPYGLFYTAVTAARDTHAQPYSITFLELLDASLGELRSSLQINFMVEPGWLLAQYYFAGYSAKKLTILYGEECADMRQLGAKKPNVEAVRVQMATPFGKHHTKLMLLCYEDGALRVVVSTANLYLDDWDNRTQGLWVSPRCPPLPAHEPAHAGESPTGFKRSLLRYLAEYRLPQLVCYTERVKRSDFTHVNVFLVASVPGSHSGLEWGLTRAGALLRQHCVVPAADASAWPLVAQASSLGSYGADPKLWLTGDFLQHLTKSQSPAPPLSGAPQLQLIYPSLENVQRSHDGLLGGGCLPYAGAAHAKQRWLDRFLYQWTAERTGRSRAMPHVKSYCRPAPDCARAAYFLLTSANVSKAAWGVFNKGDRALRLLSYEAGVLFLPSFVINADSFPLREGAAGRLVVPYDLPPTKYDNMTPWLSDYLY